MSAIPSNRISAFEPAARSASLFADKARLRRFLMILGVLIVAAASAFFYLIGGRYDL